MAEGGSVSVKVQLSLDPERTVTIPVTKNPQGGASDSDYSGVPASVTFNSSDTEKEFSLTATQDTADDDGEKVKLTFGVMSTGVTAGSPDETVVSITDNDHPSFTVNYDFSTYTVTEGNTVAVKVVLSADPERTVTIPLTSSGQDGAGTEDYSGVPASLTFNSGQTERSFNFAATDDSADDDGESGRLGFGTLPDGASLGNNPTTTVSITDNDGAVQPQVSVQVSFEAPDYALTEGSTVEIKVELNQDPGEGLTSGDYSGVPTGVTFNSGDTERSFTFTAVQDSADEDSEQLTLGLGTFPDSVTAGSTDETVVTVRDSIHVYFGAPTYEAYEGGDDAAVTVHLDGPAVVETNIPITADGMNGATPGDWTGAPVSLTFNSGDTQKSFTVSAYDDVVEDDGESVRLSFGNLPAGVAPGSPSTATVELMNMEDDTPFNRCPADSGQRIVLNARGEVRQAGDSVYHRVQLDPERTTRWT